MRLSVRKLDLGTTRREFLTSAAILGAGTLLSASGSPAQIAKSSAVPQTGLIDVHSHIASPNLIRELGAKSLGVMADWTADKTLEEMDGSGVSTVITSAAPAGGGAFGDPVTAPRLAHECNEYAARIAVDHPGRFGVFTNVPMPDIDATLREIAYGFDTLKADGVALFSNYGNRFLGDPSFNPVFEELNRRKAVVYAHPQEADCCKNLVPGIGYTAIEFGTNTTRAIAEMVFGGAAARYPDVRMIWAHGGGTMPFLVERFALMAQSAQNAPRFPQGFAGAASKFFYDTAFVSNEAALLALRKVVPLSQILFGTDYPYRNFAVNVKEMKECGVFNAQEMRLINRENAAQLFPRFRA